MSSGSVQVHLHKPKGRKVNIVCPVPFFSDPKYMETNKQKITETETKAVLTELLCSSDPQCFCPLLEVK